RLREKRRPDVRFAGCDAPRTSRPRWRRERERGVARGGRGCCASGAASGARLVGVEAQRVPQGEPEDLEVEGQGPVLDVVEVVLDALLDRGVAAPAVHLRPAGDAGLDAVAEHVARDLVLELAHEAGTLGA